MRLTRALTIAVFWLFGPVNLLAGEIKSITVRLPVDSSDRQGIEFANTRSCINPSRQPAQLRPGIFEFELASGINIDSALVELRSEGLLVSQAREIGPGCVARFTDRVIVQFRTVLSARQKDSLFLSFSCSKDYESSRFPGVYFVKIVEPLGRSTSDVADQFLSTGLCAIAYPEAMVNFRFSTNPDTLDLTYDYSPWQWPADNRGQYGGEVNADVDLIHAWHATKGDSTVKVAVVDASFHRHPDTVSLPQIQYRRVRNPWQLDAELPCCASQFLADWEKLNCSHGTGVLGAMAAAHNYYGIDGVAPGCRYLAISPFEADCAPFLVYTTDEDAADALLWAAFDWGAHIIVQTGDLTKFTRVPDEDTLFWLTQRALDTIRKFSHAAVFLSAGNEDSTIASSHRFARIDSSVFTIGATDQSDSIWAYSNTGPELDFVAPAGGDDVDEVVWDIPGLGGMAPSLSDTGTPCHTTGDEDHFCGAGGTSLACPKAAGIAALVLSHRPDLLDSADFGMAVYNVLRASAEDKGDSSFDNIYGWGRLNASRALAYVSRGDVIPDGELNMLDVMEALNVVVRGKPCVKVHAAMLDINCDRSHDIVDVSKLIDVVFRGENRDVVTSYCSEFDIDWGVGRCCPTVDLFVPKNDTFVVLENSMARLDWSRASWATDYEITLDDSMSFVSPEFADTVSAGVEYVLAGPLQPGLYYWRVSAFGSDCVSAYSTIWHFYAVN